MVGFVLLVVIFAFLLFFISFPIAGIVFFLHDYKQRKFNKKTKNDSVTGTVVIEYEDFT